MIATALRKIPKGVGKSGSELSVVTGASKARRKALAAGTATPGVRSEAKADSALQL